MFDNLCDFLLEGIPLSDKDSKLFDSVKSTPSLDFFKSQQNDSTNPNDKDNFFNKASLLRLIQTAFIISKKQKHTYSEKCKQFVEACNKMNTVKSLLSQFHDFKKVVLVETIIIICDSNPNFLNDNEFINMVMSCVEDSPEYLKSFLGLIALQWIKTDQIFLKKSKQPRSLWDSSDKEKTASQRGAELQDMCLTPLIFASFLCPDGSDTISDCLKTFDIFYILRKDWMKLCHKLLNKEAASICAKQIYYLVILYIRSFKPLTEIQLEQRILPLLAECLRKEPQLYQDLLNYFNVFQNQRLFNYSRDCVISISASSCNTTENAIDIFRKFTPSDVHNETYLSHFFFLLRNALAEVIVIEPSKTSIDALLLLKRFCKYLPSQQLIEIIRTFVEYNGDFADGIEIQAFFAFLFNFFENEVFSHYATKAFSYVAILFPMDCHVFLDTAMSNNKLSTTKISKIMDVDATNIRAFSSIVRTLISNHFTLNSADQEISQFVLFIITKYFPDSVYKKYETHQKRWKAMRYLLEISLDLCITMPSFAITAQEDPSYVRSLTTIIIAASNLLQSQPTPQQESFKVRADNDTMQYIIEFLSAALSLLERLILVNLTKMPEVSKLTRSFFEENSEIFSTFISLLELSQSFAPQIRRQANVILSLMCAVAARMKNISVDAFYPRTKQAVLIESAKVNLFHATSVEQTINELDFISSILNTQSALAYSFIRRIGSAYATASISSLSDIKKEYPSLLKSLSYFLSQIWRKLKGDSKIIQQISGKSNFWSSLQTIIDDNSMPSDYNDASLIVASKAYLLRCKVCSEEQIAPDLVKNILDQAYKYYPDEFLPLKSSLCINMDSFIIPSLNRTYGDMFYIDYKLLDRFLVSEDQEERQKIIDFSKDLNIKLSRIDSCTQMVQAVNALLNSRTKYEKEELVPEISNVIAVTMKILNNSLSPSSTIQTVLELLEFCMLNKKNISIIPTESDLLTILKFFRTHPLKEGFSTFKYFFALSTIESERLFNILKDIFSYCIAYSTKNNSLESIQCASEIALLLRNEDEWIANYESDLNDAMGILINTPLGSHMVNLLSIICENQQNGMYLEQCGFFDPFISDSLPCDEIYNSPFWPAMFNLMSLLPTTSSIPIRFAKTHAPQIVQFCLSEKIGNMNRLQILKIRCYALSLFLSIMQESHRTGQDLPILEDKFYEIPIIVMKMAFDELKNKPHIKLLGRIEDVNDRNEQLCSLVLLHDSLAFLNSIPGYPEDKEIASNIDSKLEQSSCEEMVLIMEKLAALSEKPENGIYLSVISRAFGFALNIYFGRIRVINEFHSSNMTPLEKNEQIDHKFGQMRSRAFQAIQSLINESTHSKLIEDANFFEKVRIALQNIQ